MAEPSADPPQHLVAFGMPAEERQQLAELVQRGLEPAQPRFAEAVRALPTAVNGADVLTLMGVLTLHFGAFEAGTNAESERPLGVFQHHLEMAQGALLALGGDGIETQLHARAVALAESIQELNAAWSMLQMRRIAHAQDEDEHIRETVIFRLRARAATVRGWAYGSRLTPVLERLLEPLTEQCEDAIGISPAAVVRWWDRIGEEIDRRLQEHRRVVMEACDWPVDADWAQRIAEQFGGSADPADATTDLAADVDTRRALILERAGLCAHRIFRFTLDDLLTLYPGQEPSAEALARLLDAWSVRPGEEIPVNRLVADNPVVHRPLVRARDGEWHFFCAWLLYHSAFELIEHVFDDQPEIFDAYLDRRAEFLEERTAELVAQALPGARVERGLVGADPDDGKAYENDVVATISTLVAILEAKAGRLHPDVRRARGRVMRERLDQLLVSPSAQAERLAQRLVNGEGETAFTRRADGADVSIDASGIRRAVTAGVTLEPVADLLPRLTEVERAGITSADIDALAYSISLFDLELVVDLLGHPSEFLHYLGRRAEIERRSFLGGDEVDLLGLYLKTGFNIGEEEFSGEGRLDVTGMSDPIDVWHARREAGMDAPRPGVERTPWWESLLTRVEERGGARWAEVGVTLCNVAPPEQAEFHAAMTELRRSIVAGERPLNDMVVFSNGPPERLDVFVGVIAHSPERNERMQQVEAAARSAAGHTGAQRLIVISWTPKPIDSPYLALALFDGPE